MSVEDRLGQTRRALAQMWSDEEATAERLRRFVASTLPAAPAPDAHAATPQVAVENVTGQAAADSDEERLALCPAAAQTATARSRRRRGATPAGARTSSSAADRDSVRLMNLVERAQAGEADAFGQLYDQYSDTVYRYVYYRVGGRATAEDLTSETFLRALRRIGTFTWQGRDFGAWLVTIARNLVADHFKSSRFRLEVTTGELFDLPTAVPGVEDAALGHLTITRLLAAVRGTSPQQQECLILRFLMDLSVTETARVMGKSEAAIKTLQHRAVRTLAHLLPDDAR